MSYEGSLFTIKSKSVKRKSRESERFFSAKNIRKVLSQAPFPCYSLRVSNPTTAQAKRREEYNEKFAAVQAGEITNEEWIEYCSMVLKDILDEEE